MKRATKGQLPHIRWNPSRQCWESYVFKGASRPIRLVQGFERGFPIVCKYLKKRHELMMKRRADIEAARQWRLQQSKGVANESS